MNGDVCVYFLIQTQVHVSKETLRIGLGVYTNMQREFKVVDTTEIESYEQSCVHNSSHTGVCFEIE